MSHWWGAKCLDCDQYSGNWCRDSADVETLIRAWPQVKLLLQLAKEVEQIHWRFSCLIEVAVEGGSDDALDFFQLHDGHNLVLRDEYGVEKQLAAEVPRMGSLD